MFKKLVSFFIALPLIACVAKNESEIPSIEVQIGEQVWQTYNIKLRTFSNGDSIRLCTNHEEWQAAHLDREPAMVFYNFDEEFALEHGAIYNEWVVKDPRSIAPKGWKVPSMEDVQKLFDGHPLTPLFLSVKGNQPEGSGPWPYINYGFQRKQDSLGFHAYPAGEVPGYLEPLKQIDFNGQGELVAWWTQTPEGPSGRLRFWNIYQVRHGVFHGGSAGARIGGAAGHYIRLLKSER